MEQELMLLRQTAQKELSKASDTETLNNLRVKYLGKKGSLTSILRGMGALSKEERPLIGKLVNEVRSDLEELIKNRLEDLKEVELQAKLARERVDVTLPGRRVRIGHKHPLTLTLAKIKETFMRMGFRVEEGPEVENDYYNFEA